MIKDLKMGTLSWTILVGSKYNHLYPYMEIEGDLGHTEEKTI